jgi:hypothetical protein
MSLKDQPAFPEIKSKSDDPENQNVTDVFSEGGMTIRQYYAGLAMQGICANPDISREIEKAGLTRDQVHVAYAAGAVRQADALIAELEKAT